MKTRESILKMLAKSGCRWTTARQDVLEVFLEHKAPLTVAEIHKKLSRFAVDLVSVYRTIGLFMKHGVIVSVDSVAEGKRYELSDTYREHHHHLICQSCGKVEDVEECFIQKIQEKIMRRTKFKIQHHDLKFLGLCTTCVV